jgi:ligand-binding SRPBCC domain-containing protein
VHHFERTTQLDASPEEAFSLSLSVNFHLQSFAASGERLVNQLSSDQLGLNDVVTWKARHFGIWWTMSSVICEYDRPRFFVDEQTKGPFKRFRHEHRFESTETGSVLHDVVELEAPLSPIGSLVQRIILNRYIEELIDIRNTELKQRLST